MKDFHHFISGFNNFKQEYFADEVDFYERLNKGQSPKAVVIGCCDSRVDPALLMGCRPGDLFVVRNVAALVPHASEVGGCDAVMASVEYGVKHLDVDHLIVLGHSGCGGIHSLIEPDSIKDDDHIGGWISLAAPALERLNHDIRDEHHDLQHRHCEEAAVLLSIENLLSYSWIHERVVNYRMMLHAWYFDMKQGDLFSYFPDTEDFELLSGSERNQVLKKGNQRD